ncbi:MAG: serine/threonine-protein kinase [Rubripirellula sp.]
MSESPNRESPQEEQLESGSTEVDVNTTAEEIMDRWEDSMEAGKPLAVETLCEACPELVDEIRDRVKKLSSVDRKLSRRKKKRVQMEPLNIQSVIDDLRFVNAGGLGEVFKGEDAKLHRSVAIKFMHTRLCADEESRSRFALEAEVTGRLEHPGVVPLYGFGSSDDERPFYAMRFIDGETLDDAIDRYFAKVDVTHGDEARVDSRRLLANFVSVCKTMAYAHNRGIVHRDIKPANVMLGRFGETIVVDWGLAVPVMRDERFKSSGEQTLMPSANNSNSGSTSGRGAGTPAFMSPEQASELAPTPASDIYSLGATLFKILSGKPPICSKSLPEIRSNLIDGKLPVLSDLRSDIPKPMQAICEKAMALHPTNRYPTALDLARDVERFLADEPVTAYTDTVGQRLMRFARRHRSAFQTLLVGLVLCMGLSIFAALAQSNSARTARDAEQKAIAAGVEIQSAKEQADEYRNKNLAMSSQFMARSIGQEIDRIWHVLEYEANSPELRELVKQLNMTVTSADSGVPSELQIPLQEWMERRARKNEGIVPALFALNFNGIQLARAPLASVNQVGQSFAFRDYYTGIGHDLAKEDSPRNVGPLIGKDVHMSAAYLSTLRGEEHLKVTFTVPIWDDFPEKRRRRIGVLGTSASIGSLNKSFEGTNAWLVDMRENDLLNSDEATAERRGLLLQYPGLTRQSGASTYPCLLKEDVAALAPLVDGDGGPLDYSISDPIAIGTKRHAAIMPVTIDGRGSRVYRTQWLVVAAEK